MASGTVKFFQENRGFGFIKPDNGGKDVFVHVSNVEGKRPLEEKQSVVFETREGKHGIEAINVRVI